MNRRAALIGHQNRWSWQLNQAVQSAVRNQPKSQGLELHKKSPKSAGFS
jgi:hypothetical protein